jgi:hypothetical protein
LGVIGAGSFLVGGIFAIIQLRGIRRANNFTVLESFNERRGLAAAEIQDLIETMPVCQVPADFEAIKHAWLDRCYSVVGELNSWGQYVEEKLFDKRLYLSAFHTQLIRLGYLLEAFTEWETSRTGTRYGKRILRMAELAKRYHSLHPLHRATVVKIQRGGAEVVVFAAASGPQYELLQRTPRPIALLRIRLGAY